MKPLSESLRDLLPNGGADAPAPADLPPFPPTWTLEHLAVRSVVVAGSIGPVTVASPAAQWSPCPHCRDHLDRIERRGDYDVAVPCGCRSLRRWAALVTASGLPAEFAGATPSAWAPSPGWPSLTALESYVSQWQANAPGRIYLGANGIGKSWLMATLLWALTGRGISVRWVDWTAFLDALKDAYARSRPESDLIAPLLGCDVLMVDELAHGSRSEWADLALERVVGRRLSAGGTLFATTNATREELPEVLGARVWSRVTGRCELRTMEGPHRRCLPGAAR